MGHTTYHIPHTTYHIPHTTYHIPHTKVYSIDRTWSWPVMSAASCLQIISHQKCRHPTPSPPSPSTVRSRDHTVLYCTIVLYSTKNEKICRQSRKEQTKNGSKTETTLFEGAGQYVCFNNFGLHMSAPH